MMKKYGFVILHYGAVDVTQHCIESIMKLDNSNECVVVIVDNDSDDDLSRKIANNDRLHIIKPKESMGFSQANNYGYKYIKDNFQPDYIIVANNDIVFKQQDMLQLIDASYKQDSWDILSPDVVSADDGQHQSPIDSKARTFSELNYTIFFNRLCLMLLPVIYPYLSKKMESYGKRDYIKEKTMDIVPCGACIILSKRFISSESKVFEPETKFYYEEYILHYRCCEKGYSIVYDPIITVIHGDGKATKNKSSNEKEKLRFVMKNTLESARIYKKLMKDA
ncbi:MAG: glycosyltransferase family 2 protein [Lachnospiraceae bacterium]|jgi:GT2 family glycosyltransferase|nr:glycosyltransferase family 2 protein [Lachnospiraceae bacterium]